MYSFKKYLIFYVIEFWEVVDSVGTMAARNEAELEGI